MSHPYPFHPFTICFPLLSLTSQSCLQPAEALPGAIWLELVFAQCVFPPCRGAEMLHMSSMTGCRLTPELPKNIRWPIIIRWFSFHWAENGSALGGDSAAWEPALPQGHCVPRVRELVAVCGTASALWFLFTALCLGRTKAKEDLCS